MTIQISLWLTKLLEVFIDLELGGGEAVLIGLELRRKLCELSLDSCVSEESDSSFF